MKLFLKIILSLLTVTVLCYGAYIYTEYQVEKDYEVLLKDIEKTLGNSNSIADYSKSFMTGELESIRDERGEYTNVVHQYFSFEDKQFKTDELFDFYNYEKGGWKIRNFERISKESYITKVYTPSDMGFKIHKLEFVPEKYSDWKKDIFGNREYEPSYFKDSNRLSVVEVYNQVLEYLLKNEISNYKKGGSSKINYLENSSSKFHTMGFLEGIKTSSYIFNDEWIAKYNIKKYHHKIIVEKSKYDEILYRNLGIALLVGLIISILILTLIKSKK